MKRTAKYSIIFSVFAVTMAYAHPSFAVGFSLGNDIDTTPISGGVWVDCNNPAAGPGMPGGHTTQYVSCSAILWSPDLVDYFVGPQGVQAEQVTLTATHQDGSKRDKSEDYDSTQGRSKKRFNLGISTLTQRPLLQNGVNQIHYVMTLAGKTAAEGDFTVTVAQHPAQRCPSDTQYYSDGFSCNNQSLVCDRYFKMNNYCQ